MTDFRLTGASQPTVDKNSKEVITVGWHFNKVPCQLFGIIPLRAISYYQAPLAKLVTATQGHASVSNCNRNIQANRSGRRGFVKISFYAEGKRQTCYKVSRLQLKCDGTRWRTGGELKGKLANGVGSQYPSHYLGTWCIQLKRTPRLPVVDSTDTPGRFTWTRPFRWKAKSGFCACAITFQLASTGVGAYWWIFVRCTCGCICGEGWSVCWVIIKQIEYKLSLYTTLFAVDQQRHVSAVKLIFRLNTKSCRKYSHAPHNDVSVSDGPHIRRCFDNIIILQYLTLCYNCLQYSLQ